MAVAGGVWHGGDMARACGMNQGRLGGRLRRFWHTDLRETWRRYQWPLVILLGLVSFILGYVGFVDYYARGGQPQTRWDLIYLTLQLFVLQSGALDGPKGWPLEVARFLAPGLTGYTAATAFAAVFYEKWHALKLRRFEDHVVVCGLGQRGMLLVGEFLARGEKVVVIESDTADPGIEQARDEGAVVIVGSATDRRILHKARVDRAKYVIAVCGDDGANAEIAAGARELARADRARSLTCFVHIVEPELCTLLGEREAGRERDGAFRLEFFNIYDSGARAILNEYPVLGNELRQPDATPHIVIVGAGRMGQSIVVHAAREWRRNHAHDGRTFRATIVDRDARGRAELLYMRHPQLRKACEIVPEEMDVESATFQEARFLFNADGECSADAVYVCFDSNAIGLTAALTILRRSKRHHVPIVVRMTDDTGLASLLQASGREGSHFEDLRAFSLLNRTCRLQLLLGGTNETLAQAIHEDYVLNQTRAGDTPQTNRSLVPWEFLPDYLKESNRRQADHVGAKLRSVNCTIAPLSDWEAEAFKFEPHEIESLAQMEHRRWMDDLLAKGWRHAPGAKDIARKTHPRLLPWETLSEEGREIHRNTARGLPMFLARANLQVSRMK
jgi:hypothetical protein